MVVMWIKDDIVDENTDIIDSKDLEEKEKKERKAIEKSYEECWISRFFIMS